MSGKQVWAVAAALAALTACNDPKSCTLLGAEAGVSISGGKVGALVEVCAATACGNAKVQAGGTQIPLATLKPGTRVDLDVTYRQDGRIVVSNVSVPVDTFQPNGKDCPPKAARTVIILDPKGAAYAP